MLQSKAYYKFIGTDLKLQKNSNKYRFGEDEQVSLGLFIIRIPTLYSMKITGKVDVLHANARFSIRLDLLDKSKLYVNNVKIYCVVLVLAMKFRYIKKVTYTLFGIRKYNTVQLS